jgi:very-short-patch-repair endonuclease
VWNKVDIARLAGRQHGAISTGQLAALGVSRATISRWVAAGWLHPVFRGVYAVGHAALSDEGWWMGAVLAHGEGAVLSHRSAAELWRMLEPRSAPIHVTIPSFSGRSKRKGIRLHRSPSMPSAATTREYGIPVTTPARTLADLQRVVSPGLHRKAIRQAEYLKLDLGQIRTDHTRSETERQMLRICQRQGVPPPQVNVPIGPYTVDLFWPGSGLVVELDSFATHGGRQSFDDDRAMEMYLTGLGLRLRRFSDTQVWNQPNAVAASLAAEVRQAAS